MAVFFPKSLCVVGATAAFSKKCILQQDEQVPLVQLKSQNHTWASSLDLGLRLLFCSVLLF